VGSVRDLGDQSEFDLRCRGLVQDLGLGAIRSVRRLTGGVASDIGVVALDDRSICVKFALAKLSVAEDWYAPVHRSRAEYTWLQAASRVAPSAVPALYGWSERENGFAMEFIHGQDVYLWKQALLEGAREHGEAAAVGDILGAIHAASTRPGFDAAPFQNQDDFNALRLEPYLRFTATRHPELTEPLNRLADALYADRTALVHGDVSPKNILLRNGGPVILDAECATMGDPAFDVGFCLNHLLLKAIHQPAMHDRLLREVDQFRAAYAAHIAWEPVRTVETRVACLLPALMLARVDGKSPVEYLSAASRDRVRAFAVAWIRNPAMDLDDFLNAFAKE
jgi:aminoglycoside phosphotransferase (APT) family kinase protein